VIDFDFSGRISPATDPFGRSIGYFNTGGGLARGVEASAAASPTRALELFASYTYTNSDERTPHAGGLRSFAIPDHQFSLVATQRFGSRALINLDLVASGDYLAPIFPSVYRFSGMVKADASFSYTWPLAGSRSLRLFGEGGKPV
jgi:iron complex outermembrane receptor protein